MLAGLMYRPEALDERLEAQPTKKLHHVIERASLCDSVVVDVDGVI
jgi:hypothetical protein